MKKPKCKLQRVQANVQKEFEDPDKMGILVKVLYTGRTQNNAFIYWDILDTTPYVRSRNDILLRDLP